MSNSKVLQIGIPRSGNLWTSNILRHTWNLAGKEYLRFVNGYRNFLESHPIRANSFGHDVIMFEDDRCFFSPDRVSKIHMTNIDAFVERTSHVWTHSRFSEASLEVLPKFDKVLYIVRDPRDVAISLSKYVHTPRVKRDLRPKSLDPDDHLEKTLASRARNWVQHVAGYLKHQQLLNIYVIFYERLVQDFDTELKLLLNYLEVELDQGERKRVKELVSFKRMHSRKPNHVRMGRSGNWVDILSDNQKERVERIAGSLLNILGLE